MTPPAARSHQRQPGREPRLARIAFAALPLLLACLVSCHCLGGVFEDEFEAANKLYEEGKFTEAAAAYQTLMDSGYVSSAVYFNLGNAFFKAGQLGRAIAAYTKAERLTPRDPDLRANLRFAREQRQGPSLSPSRWTTWLRRFSLNEWAIAGAIMTWLWLLVLAAGQLRPGLSAKLRHLKLGLGTAWLLVCLAAFLALQQSRGRSAAVIVVREAAVKNGPLEESQTAFNVFDGAELHVLDTKDQWLQVSVDSRRIGWIKRDQTTFLD